MSRIPAALRRHPIALLALFVALGGTSYAATKLPKNSVGAKQIKKNAVTSKKVKNGSLRATDFKAGELPAAAQGPKGDTGPAGPTGPEGPKGDRGEPGSDATVDGIAAGGDLTGTYPDPQIAAGAVGPDEQAAGPHGRALFPATVHGDFTCEAPDASVPGSGAEHALRWSFVSAHLEQTCDSDTGHAQLTVPRAGLYEINLNLMWVADPDGWRTAGIKAGFGLPYLGESRGPATNGTETAQSVSATVRLGEGDPVQAYAIQTSGGPLGFVDDGRTHLSVTWVGP